MMDIISTNKTGYYMKKLIIYILLTLLPIVAIGQQVRTFPYFLPLTGTSKPAEILEGNTMNAPTGTNRYTKDGLVITDDKTNHERSGFALNQIQFASNFGIIVEFEYAMFGGTTNPGDGMSFFLFDASKSFALGYAGSALGYVYSINPNGPNYIPGTANTKGVPGGFLSVGLDAWGDNKLKISGTNQKMEGIPKNRQDFNNDGKEHITIRGGVNTNNNNGLGYPVLYTTATKKVGSSSLPTAASRDSNGNYILRNDIATSDPFDLRTSKAANGTIEYNKIKIILLPTSYGSILINMYVTSKGKERLVVNNLEYHLSSKSPDYNGNIYTSTTTYPSFLKLGFAGSTGEYRQNQIVKNIKVNLPYAPETKEDSGSIELSRYSSNKGKKINIAPFTNDAFYKGAIGSNPTKGNNTTFIDSKSFHFEDSRGNILGNIGSDGSAYYYEAGVGNWDYNPVTRQVSLTLSEDFYGTDTSPRTFSIYYSAKGTSNDGGPFNDEYYRSEPTLIKVNATKNSSTYFSDIMAENRITTSGVVDNGTVSAGQAIQFNTTVRNMGTEAIGDGRIEIPLPSTVYYAGSSIDQSKAVKGTVTWVPPSGAAAGATSTNTPGGTLVWNFNGDVPTSANNTTILGSLTYNLRALDCSLVSSAYNPACLSNIEIGGSVTGRGRITGTNLHKRLVKPGGQDESSYNLRINASYCSDVSNGVRIFEASCTTSIRRSDIVNAYPLGTKFYRSAPGTSNYLQTLVTGDFSATASGTPYYAILPGSSEYCYLRLSAVSRSITSSPIASDISACERYPLDYNNHYPSTSGVSLYYYNNSTDSTPLTSAPKPTAPGTYTYWVAEGSYVNGALCVGPKKSFRIIITKLPTIENQAGPISICTGDSYTLQMRTSSDATNHGFYYTLPGDNREYPLEDSSFPNEQVRYDFNTKQLRFKNASKSLNGLKLRYAVFNNQGCSGVSDFFTITVKDCAFEIRLNPNMSIEKK